MPNEMIATLLENVKGVLIDLDNTLYDYELAHQKALQACYPFFLQIKSLSFEQFTALYREARQQVTARLHPQGACRSRLLAFQAVFEAAGSPAPYVNALLFDQYYWNHFLESMVLYRPAAQLIEYCAKMTIPICVITDMTTEIQIRKLEKLQLTGQIAHLVTSESVGCEKPDPRMFHAALQKLNITATDAIMIGDDQVKDIDGALRFGIRAYYMCANGDKQGVNWDVK